MTIAAPANQWNLTQTVHLEELSEKLLVDEDECVQLEVNEGQ